jgi:hypothetical protein
MFLAALRGKEETGGSPVIVGTPRANPQLTTLGACIPAPLRQFVERAVIVHRFGSQR